MIPRLTLLAGALLAAIFSASPDLSAQVVDDRMVPGGTVRVSGWPAFSSWADTFQGDDVGRTPLGAGLSTPNALGLFPGSGGWVDGLRALAGDPAYAPILGPTEGRVTQDVTRVDVGLDLGITDWWTVGATLPRVKNRTAVALVFTPDTLAGDLGVSPAVSQGPAVSAFLLELEDRADATRTRAENLCGSGAAECSSATALADEAALLSSGFAGAYAGMPFFPLSGSAVAAALDARVAAFDADLQAAGLAGLTAPLALADARPTEADLATLPTRFSPLGYAAPLASRTDLWGRGDIELRTLLRLLRLGDRGGEIPPWTFDLLGGAVLRLGTGSAPRPDVPYALGTGDGQTDVELRVSGHATLGLHLSLRAGGRYGRQSSRTLVRRVSAGDAPLAPLVTQTLGEWRPGSYWGMELEPGLRLARELTLSASYRMTRRSGEVFVPQGGSPLSGPGVSSQLLGAALEYDTTAPGLDALPLRFRIRWMRAVTGSGGAPAESRVELAGELFRRLWGG